jgi:HlyD family secretion protein
MKKFAIVLLLALTACGQQGRHPWLGYGEGEDAFVSAPAPGWVEKIAVTRGQAVKKGDLLFQLDDTQQRAARDQAAANLNAVKAQWAQNEASLAYAQKQLDRQSLLVRENATAQDMLDLARSNRDQFAAHAGEIEAQMKQAQAALNDAEYQLSQRRVVSLVNGRVEDIYFRAGEYVPPSTPVISVLPPENVYVRFFVPEADFGQVRLGETVSIHCDGCAKDLTAKITFVAQQEEFTPPVIFSIGNREKLVFKLEARAAGGLKINPGQPVDVYPL